MEAKLFSIQILILGFLLTRAGSNVANDILADAGPSAKEKEFDLETYQARLRNQTKMFEKELKNMMRDGVKTVLRPLMTYGSETQISPKCMRSFMKFASDLVNVKVWALKMLDASSKFPAGILSGTMSDFGAFDQCLDIELPRRGGGGEIEFRGQHCAVEIAPKMPAMPRNMSMAKQEYASPLDSIAEEIRVAGMALFYLKFRFSVCVPSLCTLEDMRNIAQKAGESFDMEIKIPQCYVREVNFQAVHIAVICGVSLLLIICIYGSVVEYNLSEDFSLSKHISVRQKIFCCFSIVSNFRRLTSPSKGSEELKVLHGLRALSMAWVMLGHTYIWLNFQLLSGTNFIVHTFNSWTFGPVMNAWLSVESFFFLSGLLTSYAALKIMAKMKGRINVPLYILRRYIRTTPSLLLLMGLAFFMPLVSSGPFWYERVEPELQSCRSNWWTSVLYISNWMGFQNICIHPTWFLSADFQLHVFSVIFLFIFHRSQSIGLFLIVVVIFLCNGAVGFLTYTKDLPPIIPVSTGNDLMIQETIDSIHLMTFTHAGPYFVGFLSGVLILRCKDIRMNKMTLIFGWSVSITLALTSLYGAHRWNIGEPHGPFLSSVFAALHRTTFTIGVAWVTFACVTGYGGIVNRILSSSIFAPFGRLTFMAYLLHSLVIWVRMGSRRERIFYSHYNAVYEFVGNIVFTLILTIPFYLILEAPLSNLDRLLLSRSPVAKVEAAEGTAGGHLCQNMANCPEKKTITSATVELKSVKVIELGQQNLGFEDVSKKD
ncbi:nose resistant to fluoxetine protein 6-like [Uloborus diversus]|uniref:nose resistant to fluoxetine protein 6-like n=1 Tax=Uloborus diversus TaxID=327109 RepID=UPI00240A3950|nr:nose resistant to fluoxetine protein 6-like [Uloborus diversus]